MSTVFSVNSLRHSRKTHQGAVAALLDHMSSSEEEESESFSDCVKVRTTVALTGSYSATSLQNTGGTILYTADDTLFDKARLHKRQNRKQQ